MCVAPTRAEAEDLAAAGRARLEALPAVIDMLAARAPTRRWCTSTGATIVFLTTAIDDDFAAAKAKAAYRSRASSAPRASAWRRSRAAACWRNGTAGSTSSCCHSATQQPHIVRAGLAECLGLDEGRSASISPDVGGGFGYKGVLLAEEVCARLARACKLGASGALDRGPPREPHGRRQLPRASLSRHRLCGRAGPAARARLRRDRRCRRLLGLSVLGLPRGRPGRQHPARPYDFPHYRCRTYSVATNKPPILPYRGVARTACASRSRSRSKRSRARSASSPRSCACAIWCGRSRCRSTTSPGGISIRGDYPEALRRAVAAIGLDAVRARQRRGEPDGRRIGVGLAMYSRAGRRTAPSVYARVGHPFRAGLRASAARASPPTAALSCASARTAMARAWRRRSRRSRTTILGVACDASSSCMATPR